MNNLTSLQDFKDRNSPHLQGQARCMLCHHEWQAVAPVGMTWIECPSCHSEKGYFLRECQPPIDFECFSCSCGSDLLHLVKDLSGNTALLCANCGVTPIF